MNSHVINYDGRKFIPVSNSESGEVSSETVFYYHQEKNIFWAEYAGGAVRKGFMLGTVLPGGQLEFSYQHLNHDFTIRCGTCVSTPEVLDNGLLRLHEEWQWNDRSHEKGRSIVEEIPL